MPFRLQVGHMATASCLSNAAVMSGLHLESVMWPSGDLFPVSLNTNRGSSAKSRSLARKAKINYNTENGRAYTCPSDSLIALAMALAISIKLNGMEYG